VWEEIGSLLVKVAAIDFGHESSTPIVEEGLTARSEWWARVVKTMHA
jgi:hypothetical protein